MDNSNLDSLGVALGSLHSAPDLRTKARKHSPPSFRAAEPPRIRGRNKSPASCFDGGILSPWGRVKSAQADLVRGKLAIRLGWKCSRRGLRESQHWGGATLRTNGVASSPPTGAAAGWRPCLADSPSRGEFFALLTRDLGLFQERGEYSAVEARGGALAPVWWGETRDVLAAARRGLGRSSLHHYRAFNRSVEICCNRLFVGV